MVLFCNYRSRTWQASWQTALVVLCKCFGVIWVLSNKCFSNLLKSKEIIFVFGKINKIVFFPTHRVSWKIKEENTRNLSPVFVYLLLNWQKFFGSIGKFLLYYNMTPFGGGWTEIQYFLSLIEQWVLLLMEITKSAPAKPARMSKTDTIYGCITNHWLSYM